MFGFVNCLLLLLLLSVSLKAEVFKYTTQFKQTYRDKQAEANTFADIKSLNFLKNTYSYLHADEPNYSWQYPPEYATDKEKNKKTQYFGFINNPSTQVRHIRRTKDKLIFDVVYSFDEYSRRVVPLNKKPNQNKFLVLFGCSFTQGNALNDDQTLGYFLAKHSPDYFPYNYGIGGTGMSTVLALTEKTDFKQQIPEPNGAFVYVYIEAHPRRSLGVWPEIQWSDFLPYYRKSEEGPLVHAGSIAEARPHYVKTLKTIGKLFGENILSGRVFPYLKSDELMACEIVAQTRDNLKKIYADSKFIIYGHPSGGLITGTLHECLVKKNIHVYQGFVKEFLNNESAYMVEGDDHPNSAANELIALDILKAVNSL